MTNQRISVVVRCHNYGRFLTEALNSVDDQSRRVHEVIVVNDGSTDETGQVLDELRRTRHDLVVVERHPARGPARSFNDGVARSSGDLVVALDADDRFPPNYIEELASALDDPSVDFAYCGVRTFGAQNAYRPPEPFDADELVVESFVNVSAMFRRWVFDATGGFRPEFDSLGLEDWEFWVNAVEHGAVGRPVEGCWLEYRRHPGGSRNTARRGRVLRAHLLVWRLHPRLVTIRHLLTWMGRSASRNTVRLAGAMRPDEVYPPVSAAGRDVPLVSIVTPTFNMVDRLPRCVESVAAQSYPRIEHVVVDGCSADGTVDYLSGQHHLTWISEPDSGQSNALNKGFAMANGEIVTWLNADDVLLPGSVEAVVNALRAVPEAGWAYGDLEVQRGDERWLTKPPPQISARSFRRGNVISQPGTFFTASALRHVGGIDEDFHLTMDFELWLRFARAKIPAVYVPFPLARFEVHEASKTGSEGSLAFALEEFRALQKHGEPHAGAMAIDRWYWDETLSKLAELLVNHQYREARAVAHEARTQLHPVFGRARLFLWAVRLSCRLARPLVGLKRSRRM